MPTSPAKWSSGCHVTERFGRQKEAKLIPVAVRSLCNSTETRASTGPGIGKTDCTSYSDTSLVILDRSLILSDLSGILQIYGCSDQSQKYLCPIRVGTRFRKDFWFCGLYQLIHSQSSLPSQCKSHHRQNTNKWAWLCSNTALFTKTENSQIWPLFADP